MSLEVWLAFAAASVVLLIIPGPTGAVRTQLWILSVTFVVLASINATLYAVFAATARRMLSSPRAQRRFNLVGGSLLTGAGIWALLARRAT